jgi:hypothetical protein
VFHGSVIRVKKDESGLYRQDFNIQFARVELNKKPVAFSATGFQYMLKH